MYMKLKVVVLLIFVGIFSGCASVNKMPLNEKAKDIDTTKKSVLLGRISIQNQNKPSHQPKLLAVFIKKDGKDFSFTKNSISGFVIG